MAKKLPTDPEVADPAPAVDPVEELARERVAQSLGQLPIETAREVAREQIAANAAVKKPAA